MLQSLLLLTETPRLLDEVFKGGPVMFPLLLLSILTLTTALERGLFWIRLLIQEDRIVRDVLDAAAEDLAKAREIAEYARHLAIGRFLLAPLKLRRPSPETFRLAMEATADKEFARMRRGDKLLETIIALAPLLGLLGTVTGLIRTFNNLNVGGGGSSAEATQAASGIGEPSRPRPPDDGGNFCPVGVSRFGQSTITTDGLFCRSRQ